MTIYCVYLTVYKGNKLPPFYIGSTSIEKIENGYHGSVISKKYKKIWNNEIICNPKLFSTYIIGKFNDRNEAYSKEEQLQRKLNVIANPLYINLGIGGLPPALSGELNPFYGKRHKQETITVLRQKSIDRNFVGENNPFYGRKHSLVTKQLIGEKKKGSKHSSKSKKQMSQSRQKENNSFFGKSHSNEQKDLWSNKRKFQRWYNNGLVSILRINDPGNGWVLGRLPIKKSNC
jgi:hypothetical protein